MNIAEWSIRNNRTTAILLLLLILTGVQTYLSIPRLENPDFTVRAAVVITRFPGASPMRVENLVTSKLEKKIRQMAELKNVVSQSLTGVSIITVEIQEKYYDMEPIWDDLREKVRDAARDLPQEASQPVVNDEFGDVFGILVGLTSDGYSYSEMEDYADWLRDELLQIGMIAKIEIHGIQPERIYVEFSNARLSEFGFSPYELAQFLETQNVIQPGGSARVGPERIVIEPTGEFESLEQLRKTSLRIPGRAETIYLQDIAHVWRDFVDPPEELTRVNGKKSLVVAISMVEDGNIVQLGRLVKERLDSLVAELPIGLDFEIVAFQPAFVERSVKEFMVNLGEAFFFVVIVMLLFAGLRMGLIAGLLVPMAMLMCVTLMPAFGVKLQQVSIAALIISLGILVDNGVVVSENILVRLAAGQERVKAARGAVSELSKPLLMASLTTIFAFLPIATADSAVGEYTLSLFIVVTLTLLSSWLLAMTMIPLLCYTFLKPRKKEQTFSNRFYHVYRRFLLAVLKNRLVFIILVLLALFGGFRLFQMVPTVFFPPNDREQFTIDFWQPYGSDIRTTAGRVAALEEFLLNYTTGKEGNENQPVESVASFVGYGGPRWYLALDPEQSNPSYCFMLVNVHQYKGMHEVIRGTRQYLNERFPDTRHSISPLENGPPVGAPIQIRIKGNNIDKIYKVRDRIAGEISSITGVLNIRDNWGEWTKKLIVDVNQDQAKFAGFTSRDIALSLQSQVSGMTATQYREGEDIIPIVLRSKEAYRESLGRIETLNVYSYLNGASVPLLRVADTRLVWQPSNIRRRNEIRTLTLKTDVKGRYPSEVLADIIPLVEKLKESDFWPRGYAVEYGGEFEKSREANQSIIAGLPLAFGLILLVLVYQFNSIRRPMIIALSIPPMIIGISIGLLLTNAPFGFMAMLGMISLTGIIVNNAIMLIDRVEIEKERGQNPPDAVVIASQRRLRPILMTTLTTMVGLIPLSIQGGEMWRPMANTLIFGLAFATILTLGLCPVLYSVLFRIGFKGYSWDSGVLNRSDD